jgi:hypothetical protein
MPHPQEVIQYAGTMPNEDKVTNSNFPSLLLCGQNKKKIKGKIQCQSIYQVAKVYYKKPYLKKSKQ